MGIGYEPAHKVWGNPMQRSSIRMLDFREVYLFSGGDVYYAVNGYVVSRQCPRNGKLDIPKVLDDIEISPTMRASI